MRGYEGAYEVSNLGRVRSLDRVLPDGRKWKGRIREPVINCKWRRREIMLSATDGSRKLRLLKVYAMVAEAFIGPRPAGHDINHKDGNKLNDAANNLEYATRSENARHWRSLGHMVGESHTNAKLTMANVFFIRRMFPIVRSTRLALAFNVTRSAIIRAAKGFTWRTA